MDTFPKPHQECYVFDDPSCVYDLTGWNPDEKLYRLENDQGKKRYLRYFEFCPVSSAGQEEIEAGDDGKLYTVQQLVDSEGKLCWKRPAWAVSEAEGAPVDAPSASGPAPAPKAKERQAKAQREPIQDSGTGAEAKARVRELLEPCKTREDVANVGHIYLGEDAGELLNKYMHLDNGRFRMTIGNRMVGLYKRNGGF